MANACVLISDITGSTSLYEQVTQREALNQISLVLDRMRAIVEENEGHCVKSQGDDTLSFFARSDRAFAAARAMITEDWPFGLDVHAGIYTGDVLSQNKDIYGNAVNTAARLASLAKAGEVLIGDVGYDDLTPANKMYCVAMGGLKLKGKKEPTRVYSYTASQESPQTVVFGASQAPLGRRTESAEFEYNQQRWQITDGQSLTIGRSEECDIVLSYGWISRTHGKLELRESQLEYTDQSSSGSFVITADGQEFELHRRGTLLNGDGILLLGTRDRSNTVSIVHYGTNDLIPDGAS